MNSMQLLEMFRLSKTIEMNDGEVKIMGTPVNILPTAVLADFQRALIDSRGFREAYNLIYNTSKNGSYSYNKNFIQNHKFKDKRGIVDWQWKIVTLAGWGKWSIIELNTAQNSLIAKFEGSPFPKIYGKSKFPVDIIPAGFTAGGVSAGFGADLDGFESKCVAMGDSYCQIEIGPKELIQSKREEFWKKLGL